MNVGAEENQVDRANLILFHDYIDFLISTYLNFFKIFQTNPNLFWLTAKSHLKHWFPPEYTSEAAMNLVKSNFLRSNKQKHLC